MNHRGTILATALLAALSLQAHATDQRVAAHALARLGAEPALAHASAWDRFIARDTIVDRNGDEHVRFDRTYRGLRVIGGDVVVHTAVGGHGGVSMSLAHPIRLAIAPLLPADEAIVRAGSDFGTGFEGLPKAELVVYARHGDPRLAYEVLFSGTRAHGMPTRMRYYVDADSGALLAHWDTIETTASGTATTGSGNSLLDGPVQIGTQRNARGYYDMKDPTRGGSWTVDMGNSARGVGVMFSDGDNVWGDATVGDRSTAAVDAHWGIARTWDFYRDVLGRLGVANDGVGAMARVHFATGFTNAFWNDGCFCMTFGDGDGVNTYPFTALDVTGHEMSHGVTSRTANLDYEGESGGLNEATSDIMGTMVEYHANNPENPPNYLIGEKLFIGNGDGSGSYDYALRAMYRPSLDGISPDCFPTNPKKKENFDSYDVHYSSGVANHFYYLLAEGSVVPAQNGFGLTPADLVCRGSSALKGIGRDAAAKIWYRALTVYMTSATDYPAARVATLDAAADLYGPSSRQYQAVRAAWNAVHVN